MFNHKKIEERLEEIGHINFYRTWIDGHGQFFEVASQINKLRNEVNDLAKLLGYEWGDTVEKVSRDTKGWTKIKKKVKTTERK